MIGLAQKDVEDVLVDAGLCLKSPESALPRGGEKPRVCPKCKSYNWDRPKQVQA